MYLKILIRENLFYVNLEYWDRNTPSNSRKAPGTNPKNSGKKGSIARCYPKVCASWAKSLRAKIWGKITWGDLARARKAAWDLAKNIYNLKNSDKAAFKILGQERVMPAPTTSKRPEEREFVVDSGASIHMMSKKEFCPGRDWHSN